MFYDCGVAGLEGGLCHWVCGETGVTAESGSGAWALLPLRDLSQPRAPVTSVKVTQRMALSL